MPLRLASTALQEIGRPVNVRRMSVNLPQMSNADILGCPFVDTFFSPADIRVDVRCGHPVYIPRTCTLNVVTDIPWTFVEYL